MNREKWLVEECVSRETIERLEIYEKLLLKWNAKINLVSASTLPEIWTRHFLDSYQICELAGVSITKWCDIGTGAGFPGLVAAIYALENDSQRKTVCIESDLRKATFLRTVARELDLRVEVIAKRIESSDPQNADIVSARALAPLNILIEYADRHVSKNGVCLFLKGENYTTEVKQALETWCFDMNTFPSKTNKNAVILKIGNIQRG